MPVPFANIPFAQANAPLFAQNAEPIQQQQEIMQEQAVEEEYDNDNDNVGSFHLFGRGGSSGQGGRGAASHRTLSIPPVTKAKVPVVYLTEGGAILRIPLRSIQHLQMQDSELQAQLITALAHRRTSKFPQPKVGSDTSISIITSDLHAHASTPHTITTSYVSESAPWTCSYRLEAPSADTVVVHGQQVMDIKRAMQPHDGDDDDDATASNSTTATASDGTGGTAQVGGQTAGEQDLVVLHVMARVQNTSDYDWNDVEISLVANELQLVEDPTKIDTSRPEKAQRAVERLQNMATKKGYSSSSAIFIKVCMSMGVLVNVCVFMNVCACVCVFACIHACLCMHV